MTAALTQINKTLRILSRAIVMTMFVAAPVLAVPSIRGGDGTTIEAPAVKNNGVGFVLVVSLQRD